MYRYDEIKKHLWSGGPEPDEIARKLFETWDDLFAMSQEEVEAWQLCAVRARLDQLLPALSTLASQAEVAGFKGVEELDDVVPLLFQHTQYKSYPMSLLEKDRFDLLTRWLGGLTTVDLSAVDAKSCEGIDDWLQMLEDRTDLKMFHTSGSTGKLSFLPRSHLDYDLFCLGQVKMFEGYGGDPGSRVGFDGQHMPVIYPSVRNSRHAAQHVIRFLAQHVTPSPEEAYTLSEGTLSADVLSLGGRIRVAQSKGTLKDMELSDKMRHAMRQYLNDMETRPAQADRFMRRMMEDLKGHQVYMYSQTNYLVQAAMDGLERGMKQIFSPDSIGIIGGGGKGMVLPDNWMDIVKEFTGVQGWRTGYGMTELVGCFMECSEGHNHAAPFHLPFLLDPDSGQPLPRQGTQTGRFAFVDLIPSSYWGGVVTGDKVTIDWDKQCACGRKGAYLHHDIVRYRDEVAADDRVTCAETIDNTDSALKALLAV